MSGYAPEQTNMGEARRKAVPFVLEKDMNIQELANDGKRPDEIADELGIALSTVYYRTKKSGVVWKYKKYECEKYTVAREHMDMMREYKATGKTNKQVADRFGISPGYASKICKGISSQRNIKSTEEYVRTVVAERAKGATYVDGYSGCDGTVRVMCNSCGTVEVKTYRSIAERRYSCNNCRVVAEKMKVACREREREERRARRIAIRNEKLERIAARLHMCPVCGTETSRPRYCCNECQRKARNKTREIRRRVRIKAALIDKDITLEKLSERDGNRCHICGMKVLQDDYVIKDGTMVCGDWYPSIDHVEPLSRGGRHAWDNVRLAHRRCNYMKRDRVPPPKN